MMLTRRGWLIAKVLMSNPDVTFGEAVEAVSSTAIEHPEWDMDELRTWDEWEKETG